MNDLRKWARLLEALTPSQTQIVALIRGVKAGKVLVHVRVTDGTDFEWGLEPSAGTFLRSTESWQDAEAMHGEGPELIFFADSFSWVSSKILAKVRGDEAHPMQALFVRKSDTIFQYIGDGKVRTSTGKVMPYERCKIADYENPLYADLPAGVETGDWFTNETQDVLAVVDVHDLLPFLKG